MTPVSGVLEVPPSGTGELLDGRYRLASRIGEGSMGRVYRATDEMLGREVAVKVFHAHTVEGANDSRTASEARLLASVNHPCLVTLYDARFDTDAPGYLVMELIEGPDLRDRLQTRPLDAREAAFILQDLAEALDAIHSAGVVHRDVKPSNVMLRETQGQGRPFRATLADFGIAYLLDSTRITTPGTVVGTASYLAPEQVRGEAPRAASDIYALGLLLIEGLTGTRPFGSGSLQEVLAARLARRPDIPASIGGQWRALLLAMTSSDPEARPSAARIASFAKTLEESTRDKIPDAAWDALLVETQPIGVTVPLGLEIFDRSGAQQIDDDEAPEPERRSPSPRVLWALAAVAAVLLVVLVGTVLIVMSGALATAPTPLPSLPDPLEGHLRLLIDELTP